MLHQTQFASLASAHPLQCDVAGNLAHVHGAGGQERLHLIELQFTFAADKSDDEAAGADLLRLRARSLALDPKDGLNL
jgi:hypothetical protein